MNSETHKRHPLSVHKGPPQVHRHFFRTSSTASRPTTPNSRTDDEYSFCRRWQADILLPSGTSSPQRGTTPATWGRLQWHVTATDAGLLCCGRGAEGPPIRVGSPPHPSGARLGPCAQRGSTRIVQAWACWCLPHLWAQAKRLDGQGRHVLQKGGLCPPASATSSLDAGSLARMGLTPQPTPAADAPPKTAPTCTRSPTSRVHPHVVRAPRPQGDQNGKQTSPQYDESV